MFVDKDLATSLGIDIKKLGMLLQTVSCTIAGGCGVLYGFIYKSFHLDFFTFALVGIAMTIIFVGGYATHVGLGGARADPLRGAAPFPARRSSPGAS